MEQALSPVLETFVCECGAVLIDTSAGGENGVTCEACGRAVKPSSLPSAAAAVGSGPEYVVSADPRARIRAAAAFVNQGKYVEALALYKWVHDEDFEHRDALYGMGFCYYKLGYLDRSQWLLERAQEMNHPSAGKLLRKVTQRMEAASASETAQV